MKAFHIILLNAASPLSPEKPHFVKTIEFFLSGLLIGLLLAITIGSVYLMLIIAKYYLSAFFGAIKSKENLLEVRFRQYNTCMIIFFILTYIFIKYVFMGGLEPPSSVITSTIICIGLCGFIISWVMYTAKALRKFNWLVFFILSVLACTNIILCGILSDDIIGTIFSICAGLVIFIAIACSILIKRLDLKSKALH